MINSPRVTATRTSSTRIPRPSNLNMGTLRTDTSSKSINSMKSTVSSGEYVELSSTAIVNDEKNNAFIASSSMSCLDFEPSLNKTRGIKKITNKDVCEDQSDNWLRLTPLINEIDNLTRNAQELGDGGRTQDNLPRSRSHVLNKTFTPPTPVEKVEQKFRRAMKESQLIEIKNESEGTPRDKVNYLERRFSVQEGTFSPSQRKIRSARRKSERVSKVTPSVNTPQFRSMRTPRDGVRIKSCRVTPSLTPELSRSPNRCTLKRGRPNTMKSGLSRPSPVRGCNSIQRGNKNNCKRTLTLTSLEKTPISKNSKSTPTNQGAKISAQNTSHSCEQNNNLSLKREETGKENKTPTRNTPRRRRSSVQELVKLMEPSKKVGIKLAVTEINDSGETPSETGQVLNCQQETLRKNNESIIFSSESPDWTTSLPRRRSVALPKKQIIDSLKADRDTFLMPRGPRYEKSVMAAPRTCPARNKPVKRMIQKVDFPSENSDWVPGTAFNFDIMNRFKEQRHQRDRDSIHVLKTLNAGKVSANVKLFDGMNCRKSPGRSLIPRYTALLSKNSGTN